MILQFFAAKHALAQVLRTVASKQLLRRSDFECADVTQAITKGTALLGLHRESNGDCARS